MKYIVNTVYAVLTWIAAFVILGLDDRYAALGWSLLAMASLQSFALFCEAFKEMR